MHDIKVSVQYVVHVYVHVHVHFCNTILYVFVFQLWLGCSRLGNILVYDLDLFTLQQNIAVDSAGISYMCHIKNQVNNVY